MRFQSASVVSFDADSVAEANQIAMQHLEQIRDEFSIQGADHSYDISLAHVYADGHDIFKTPKDKRFNNRFC